MAETVAKMRKVTDEHGVVSPSIGLSWFKALETEFKKPYFAALSTFVSKERATAIIFPSFEEVEEDIPGFKRPSHGFLGGWADQGVLLLNSVLTVRSGEANSHKGCGWEQLTDAVIKWISDNCRGVVFMLWGGYAQKKAAKTLRSIMC